MKRIAIILITLSATIAAGAQDWHKGLNVNVDFSAYYLSGKHLHGGGFGQRIAATYLAPLTEKLWVAAGGYVSNATFKGDSFRDGGFYGVLGYKFNEHWEAYLYGQKSVANNYTASPYYYHGFYGNAPLYSPSFSGMGVPGADVIGAAVKYNFSPTFSVAVSVEGVWYQNHDLHYPYQYKYPVPEP